jgi:hypothetical protein
MSKRILKKRVYLAFVILSPSKDQFRPPFSLIRKFAAFARGSRR